PTRDDRGWYISPLGPNPWWTAVVSVVPALLCTILIFMDQHITTVIITRKEHQLEVGLACAPAKGCGYHLDLLVVGVMLGVCSMMGLTWLVAATGLSISHVNSLKLESECSVPGEQPRFLGIREQRFTGLMIFTLMGCSVFVTSVLKFFDRLKLFFMPAKHQPDFIYLWHVLALVFIRKLLDCVFTKPELSWLNDLMPENKKKILEDEEVEAQTHVH
ncbi:hypothetical protein CRUP_014282, partial [Coryphaenoides rupestris]